MVRAALPACLLAALALGACAPDLGKMPGLRDIEGYVTGKSYEAPVVAWPHDRWWQSYGDPQLDALVDEALAGAPDMAIAKARLDAAHAEARIAGADLYPSLDANGSVVRTKQSYNMGYPAAFQSFLPHGWKPEGQTSLDLTYQLDLWGRNRAALAAATGEAQAAAADAAQARLVLTTQVVAAYAQFVLECANRAEAQRGVEVHLATEKLFADRQKHGLENIGSLKQVQAERAGAEAEVAALDEQIGQSRNKIAALLGQGPDRGLALAMPKVELHLTRGLPENIPANLLGRRPDIVAARLRAEAAAKDIDVAHADYYPNINLSATFGYQSLGLGDLFEHGSQFGHVGPAVSLPIFGGGARDGRYRKARAGYDEAVATYDKTLASALQDVADVAVGQKALAARRDKVAQALAAAEVSYKVAGNRYRGGLATYLDVLNAEDTVIANRRANIDLQAQAFALDVRLVKALGGGYGASDSETIEQVKKD